MFADLYYLSDEKKVLLDKANELKIPIFICSNNITEEIKKYDVQGITSKPLTRYKIYELLQGLDESDIKNHLVEEKEKLNILICDDTLINLEVLYSLLIKNNYNVHKVMDSNEALKMFENSSEGYYSAGITDKVMPNLDGFELTEAIRNLNRKDNNVAIILTSADYTKEDLIKGKEVKVDAYIDKPVFIEFKTTIGKGSMLEGTNKVHGTPLTKEDIRQLKDKLNLDTDLFKDIANLRKEMSDFIKVRVSHDKKKWETKYNAYLNSCDNDTKRFLESLSSDKKFEITKLFKDSEFDDDELR